MKYRYIHFVKIDEKPKTSVWSCRNNKDDFELGIVRWHAPWRQYLFFTSYALYSAGCLDDISDFIKKQMAARG